MHVPYFWNYYHTWILIRGNLDITDRQIKTYKTKTLTYYNYLNAKKVNRTTQYTPPAWSVQWNVCWHRPSKRSAPSHAQHCVLSRAPGSHLPVLTGALPPHVVVLHGTTLLPPVSAVQGYLSAHHMLQYK